MSQNKPPENPEEKESRLLDHNYDGIQELDNRLPNWWLAILYLSIAFSIGYFGWYELGPGQSLQQEYQAHVEKARLAALSKPAEQEASEEELVKLVTAPGMSEKGHGVFQAKCSSCHGDSGQGNIGPNLSDEYWLHGGKLAEIGHTIREGVPEKGMPPWKAVLSPDEVKEVLAYIRGIRGKTFPGAKAPQGSLVQN